MTADPFDLERFITAQSGTYEHAVAELRRGQKTSHWMWFVFPQIAGLGQSATSRRYAITSLSEARAYLAHPVLGPRLRECTSILVDLSGRTAEQIFGSIDAQKLRSSMTLFQHAELQHAELQHAELQHAELQHAELQHADPSRSEFQQVLARYFGGAADAATMERL
jgi:uncharacterized protein (DUF1810 family)